MAKTIAVIGALDTKGDEFAFVKREIERRGHHVVMVDTGVVGQPAFKPDVAAHQIADAGGTSLQQLRETADRGQAMKTMADGVAKVVEQLHRDGKIHAVLGMGGGAGTVRIGHETVAVDAVAGSPGRRGSANARHRTAAELTPTTLPR